MHALRKLQILDLQSNFATILGFPVLSFLLLTLLQIVIVPIQLIRKDLNLVSSSLVSYVSILVCLLQNAVGRMPKITPVSSFLGVLLAVFISYYALYFLSGLFRTPKILASKFFSHLYSLFCLLAN